MAQIVEPLVCTGATGFVGSEVLRQAVAQGLHPLGLGRGAAGAVRGSGYRTVDILDASALRETLDGSRTVVHAAALAHVFDRRRTDSALFTAVNEIGTANVVRAAVEGGASRIVLVSTVAAHAASAADAGQGGPSSPYATSKWRAEQRAREITDAAGVPLIVLRLAIVYGEEDPGNIGRLMRAIDRGRFVWIGDGSNRKSLIYREDAARACLLAAGDGDTGCATYDVSAPPHTMREIVSVLAEALGRRTPPIRLPAGIARPLADAATWLGGGRGRLGAVGAAVTKWLTDDVYDSCRFAAAFDSSLGWTFGKDCVERSRGTEWRPVRLPEGRARVRELVLCAAATGIAYVAVGGLRQWAERHRMVDVPNARSSHTRPTPRGGGLAIVAITLGGAVIGLLIGGLHPGKSLLAYAAGAAVVASVSWIDDLRTLSTRTRFVTHAVGATVALWAFGWWTSLPAPGLDTLSLGWAGLPITLFWVLGLTNAYNFMDGIDGIAGGQAVVAGLGWAALGILGGQPLVAALGLLIAGSSLGFLLHNWPPARIFMGDVGSAFLGYSFAVLPLLLAHLSADPIVTRRAPVLGVLMVWPFVFDAAFTFLRRLARRENVLEAHRSHLYQRLVIVGHSHQQVTVLYMVLAALGAVAAVALARTDGSDGLVGTAMFLAWAALVLYVRREERHSPAGLVNPG